MLAEIRAEGIGPTQTGICPDGDRPVWGPEPGRNPLGDRLRSRAGVGRGGLLEDGDGPRRIGTDPTGAWARPGKG